MNQPKWISIIIISICFSCSPNPPAIVVGQNYQGGVVFYVDGSGQHGLIAAPVDQAVDDSWSESWLVTGATGVDIGTGQSNTTAIIAAHGDSDSYAAKTCNDLELNGYSDWYLPSKEELSMMYANADLIGVFAATYYWSSTEYDNDDAWYENFGGGGPTIWNKYGSNHVRAIRSF